MCEMLVDLLDVNILGILVNTVSNGPTKTADNLIKQVTRVFGLRSFRNYRIRALLSVGKPNWSLLANIAFR